MNPSKKEKRKLNPHCLRWNFWNTFISDLQTLLRKCSAQELKEKVKQAVFVNIMMHTVGDSKKIYKKYQLYDGCRVLRHLYEGTGAHWRSAAVRTGGSCTEK